MSRAALPRKGEGARAEEEAPAASDLSERGGRTSRTLCVLRVLSASRSIVAKSRDAVEKRSRRGRIDV